YTDSKVTINATTSDTAASMAINGKAAVSGKPSDLVDVKVGTNLDVFKIVVTAQDGLQKVYSVSVTRAPSADATLSNLVAVGFSLKPAFASGVLAYADTVANALASVTLTPTVSHPAAKISINDTLVATGVSSKALALIVGDNLFKIQVTAQDGSTKSVYNVKVVRKAKVIFTRVVGTLTAQVDSLEVPLGATITVKSPDSTGFHFTKWSLTEGTGTFQDSAVNPALLTVKSATVRAKAGFDINVYTITGTIKGFVGGAYDHKTIKVEHGKDTAFTITPLIGQRLLTILADTMPLNSVDIKNPYGAKSFKLLAVTQDITVEASFLKTYTLTSSVTGNGTISPVGTVEVDSASTREYSLTSGDPANGIIVSSL
ncbi:MAG: cadherin-like beta sandwich domain-containing protein, partial [Fibrobacterota bacterium]|nr:cadherin-like beta sandwich domain-containing protein [Fibrobacterota bacterium]